VPIVLAPLRERLEDVPALTEHFLSRIALRDGRPVRRFEARAMEILQKYHWPGNVRELENICERSVVLEMGEVIRATTISPWLSTIGVTEFATGPLGANGVGSGNSGVLEEMERRMILKVLEKHNGIGCGRHASWGLGCGRWG